MNFAVSRMSNVEPNDRLIKVNQTDTDFMKVSIAMATYNGERFLNKQLHSIAAQTRLPDELMITDDCSSDNTVKIINEFAGTVPFCVKVYQNKKNIGYSANFSKSIGLCTGSVIFICDQDDVWLPNKIETMLDRAPDDQRIWVLICNREITDENLTLTGRDDISEHIRLGVGEMGYAAGSAMALSKNFAEIALPCPLGNEWVYDTWFSALAKAVDRYSVIKESLQYYRRHKSTASDSVYSQIKQANRMLLRLSRSLKVTPNSYYIEQHKRLSTLAELLSSSRECLEEDGLSLQMIINQILCQARAAELRGEITSTPLFNRAPKISRAWSQDCYKYYSGVWSIARDLLAP